MNKDQYISPLERVNLEISDEHVQRELLSCRQDYFKVEDGVPKPIVTMLKCLECVKCQKIPLNITECKKCQAIVCKECFNQMSYQENGCCQEPEIQKFSSKIMKKQINEQAMTHTCQGITKSYFMSELFEHMASECSEAKNICPNCRKGFNNQEDCFSHVKKICDLVAVQCDTCDKFLPRHKFKEHICYLKTQNFRDVIDLKLQQNIKIERETSKIAKDIEDTTYVTDVNQTRHSKLVEKASEKIEELESHLKLQEKMINQSQESYIQNKFANAQNQWVKRRISVNQDTCFMCSVDHLMSELMETSKEETKSQYFDNTKRMTEFSNNAGYTGQGKFCSLCTRECTYIQTSGVYFECTGHGGCIQITCDQCQQIKIIEFESQPFLALEKLQMERNLQDLLGNLLEQQEMHQNIESPTIEISTPGAFGFIQESIYNLYQKFKGPKSPRGDIDITSIRGSVTARENKQ